MKCDRCPLEDRCAELKRESGIAETCPIELAIKFILIVLKSFVERKK
ncbi:hypothetical protein ES703_53993 [subsurface metagenome]